MAFQTPFGSRIWDFERDKNYITFEAKYHSESKSEVIGRDFYNFELLCMSTQRNGV